MKKFYALCFTFLAVMCMFISPLCVKKPIPARPLPAYAEELQESDEYENEDIEEFDDELDDAHETLKEKNLPIEYYSEQVKICVVGEAKKSVAPDRANVYAQICGYGEDCQSAKESTFTKFDKVVDALVANGCDKSKITIESFYSRPCYDCHMGGCHGQLSISFYIEDLTKLDDTVSAVLEGGAQEISSICYEASNMEEEYNSLLSEALANAQAKAEKLLDGEVQLVDIREESVYYSNCLYKDYYEKGASYVGEVEVRTRVEATFI